MSVAPSAFSLFTAYKFLSSNEVVSNPESKMRPSPSCVCQRVSALMMEMIATSFFFAYCVSNFECWFLFSRGLDKYVFISYNTTPAKEGMRCSSLLFGCLIFLTTCLPSLGMRLTTYGALCVSSLFSIYFLSADGAIFECVLHLKTMTTYQSFGARIWPHLWP